MIGLVAAGIGLSAAFGFVNSGPLAMAALSLFAQAMFFFWIKNNGGTDRLRLMARLSGYGVLHGRSEFEILLGILKKVETKATSLAAILVFIAIALVTLGGTDLTKPPTPGSTDAPSWIMAILLTMMPSFLALTFAIRQIDNIDAGPNRGTTSPNKGTTSLSDALMKDLLYKETCFRFAWGMTIAYTLLGFAGLFVYHFLGGMFS